MEKAVERRIPYETRYLVAILLALAAILLGVVGYQLGFLGFIYNLMLPQAFPSIPVYALAAVMGVAAFFSPCVFPMLPGYMTFQLALQHGEKRLMRSLYLGLMAALGVISVTVVVGLVIAALGAAAPFSPDPRQDPWVILAPRLLGGLFVTYLGATYLLGKDLIVGPLARLSGLVDLGEPSNAHPARASFLYGFLYNLIGIGCTGALLLALMLYTLTIGGFSVAFGAFLVFAGSMGILMILMTVLVGLAQAVLVRRLKGGIPAIRRVSGAVMLAVGALTVAFVLQGNRLFTELLFPFLP